MSGGEVRELQLPAQDEEVLPGVNWGAFDTLFTPAFWAGRAWLGASSREYERFSLGSTLREELAACLLGGHGFPAEIGLAAFHRLRDTGLLEGRPAVAAIRDALSRPLAVGERRVRYRFARQKAEYLAACLDRLSDSLELPDDDRSLRNWLVELPGIGLKTASWVTRNWRNSDEVAILDIHICRACMAAGVFATGSDPSRDYLALEKRFLEFAKAIGTRASVLDNLVWQMMRRIGHRLPIASRRDHSRKSTSAHS